MSQDVLVGSPTRCDATIFSRLVLVRLPCRPSGFGWVGFPPKQSKYVNIQCRVGLGWVGSGRVVARKRYGRVFVFVCVVGTAAAARGQAAASDRGRYFIVDVFSCRSCMNSINHGKTKVGRIQSIKSWWQQSTRPAWMTTTPTMKAPKHTTGTASTFGPTLRDLPHHPHIHASP